MSDCGVEDMCMTQPSTKVGYVYPQKQKVQVTTQYTKKPNT